MQSTRESLMKNLFESAMNLKLGWRFTFHQDNDLKHKDKATLELLNKKKINVLEWPSQSLDFNPNEHLWRDLKIAVHRRSTNLAEPERFSHEEWTRMLPSHCSKPVEIYPETLIAVIAVKCVVGLGELLGESKQHVQGGVTWSEIRLVM